MSSDSETDFVPAPKTTRKRKPAASKSIVDDAPGPSRSKKARTEHSNARVVIKDFLADPSNYALDADAASLRQDLLDVVKYAASLENDVTSANKQVANASVVKKKSPEELQVAAERLRKAAVRGMESQMKWKPSCKGGGAKFAYDGVCPDPDVFGTMLGLGGAPKFKAKKIPAAEFQDVMGGNIQGSARYNTLRITSTDINVRWNLETGEFKFSGSYGI